MVDEDYSMYLGNGGLNQGHSPLGLKNRVLAGRGGEVLTMENANLHPPSPQNNEFYMYILNIGPCLYCRLFCSENEF